MKLGRTKEVLFATSRFSTGEAYDATGTPTGTIYKNGTADALSVTVSNIKTGLYKAVFTPTTGAGFAAGDDVELEISATVDSVPGVATVWRDILSTNDIDDVDTVADAIKAKTDNLPGSPAATGDAMTLEDDAITAAKFDESTAFPLKSDDSGATEVARTGADGDTLETLSDEIANVQATLGTPITPIADKVDALQVTADSIESKVDTVDGNVDAIKAKTDNLPADPAGVSDLASLALEATAQGIKAKTDLLPSSPAATGDAMTLEDDAITAAKFDESTAFPLKSADAGATEVARTGADGDTLETLSDQIDGAALETTAQAIKAKTDGLNFSGTDVKATLDGEEVDVGSVKGTSLQAKVGPNFDAFYQNAGADTSKLVDDVGTATGGNDWTSGEKENIRQALGITGTKSATSGGNLDAVKAKTDLLPADPAGVSDLASLALEATAQGIKAKTDLLPGSPAATGDAMTLQDDAITAAKFDESTAFPIKSADAGATEIARTGADGDTLETLSDQIDGAALETTAQAIKAKTDLLPADPAGVSDLASLALEATAQGIKAKTDLLPSSPAATGDEMALTADAIDAIVADLRDAKWTAGGVNTLADVLKAVFAMARGNVYRSGADYKVYDDDDTGAEDGTLLFTLTIGSSSRISS